jgi:chromosome partitioning protein
MRIMDSFYAGREIMREAFAIINQKGGVGKSTTAHALGSGLSMKGYRVLFIDLDAQANLTHTLAINPSGPISMDVLMREATAQEALIHADKWDCIPAAPSLAGADMTLNVTGKEYRLREAIEPICERYDYIVIDTPPALGILTINALTACTGAIIPAQADIYSLQGIGHLYGTIETVKKYCNSNLNIMGILMTRYNPRSILTRDITDLIQQTARELNTIVYKTTIREAIAIKEAQAQQRNIFDYAPKGKATDDYRLFVEEVLA